MLNLKDINWKKPGIFAAGVAFGTAGIKILTSDDAKKLYTNCTAAVLRAKSCVMKTATSVQENAGDILAEAKQINEDRVAEAEAEVVDDFCETEETAEDTAEADTAEAEAEADTENAATAEGVMSYADYVAAAVDTEVCVETYVQAKQAWWEDNGVGQATFYTQNQDGAFFVYNLPCSQEDYDKLVPGTKIKVTGFKSEWSGEVEITDATYEIEDTDTFVADAKDVTDLLGKDELIDYQNQFVSFKGMTVEAANDAGDAFLYKWDGSGTEGDDLYFNVSLDGNTYTFTVESYLCDKDSDVYKAVQNLKVGDVVDMEGFLYWYEGVNPHITSVSVQ